MVPLVLVPEHLFRDPHCHTPPNPKTSRLKISLIDYSSGFRRLDDAVDNYCSISFPWFFGVMSAILAILSFSLFYNYISMQLR